MCGIVGYIGSKNAAEFILSGLKMLEYRGYDSSGIAVFEDEKICTYKKKGRLEALEGLILNNGEIKSSCGIGHTRWATHGEPSDVNSHPHSCGKVTLVHNGIIENYTELKKELTQKGYTFKSQTDTESVAAMLDFLYKGDAVSAIDELTSKLCGSYALAIMFSDKPNEIYAVRKDSPLVVGVLENEWFLASDIPAFLKHTKKYILIDENEIVILNKDGIRFLNGNKEEIKKEILEANFSFEAAEKGGYPHFMIKEIYEEPKAVSDSILPHINGGLPSILSDAISDDELSEFKRIHITACGSAMHVGLIAKSVIEKIARLPVEVSLASEFRYQNPIIDESDLVIIISQSGETADSLAALRLAKEKGAKTLGIVNVVGSSIAREADSVFYTVAGPEIAVATTKAFSVQCATMLLFALRLALVRKTKTRDEIESLTNNLVECKDLLSNTIKDLQEPCKELAKKNISTQNLFFIGRGLDFAVCQEGSLKLKEISYIHSEAHAAGELKHGTISLITESVPVVALATQSRTFEKTISNIKEAKARGAYVTIVCFEDTDVPSDAYDEIVRIKRVNEEFAPILLAPFLQLFAYHTSVLRGCDVDKPRNLAKSVTVE